MDSYLIRIYRRDKKNPDAIIGIIEEIGADKQEPFGNLSELTTIIRKRKGKSKAGGTEAQRQKRK